MRIVHRLCRLEKELAPPAPPGPCLACEQIDIDSGLPVFLGGVRIQQDDGTHGCFCKRCGRSFRGRLEDAAAGLTLVSSMVDDDTWV